MKKNIYPQSLLWGGIDPPTYHRARIASVDRVMKFLWEFGQRTAASVNSVLLALNFQLTIARTFISHWHATQAVCASHTWSRLFCLSYFLLFLLLLLWRFSFSVRAVNEDIFPLSSLTIRHASNEGGGAGWSKMLLKMRAKARRLPGFSFVT
jgi:hypothetical protein